MKIILSIAVVVVILFGAGLFLLLQSEVEPGNVSVDGEYTPWPYIEIVEPTGFVNTDGEPVTISQYVGEKVILLDIMTYSCINCQRTFPYVTGWYEKYQDDGLIVIGIHTPEFAFEREIENVERAMQQHGITFPVVLDNEYATWRAYGNRFWPRKYLIDIHGNIVYDHIGEGAYEETETKIQELLLERAQVLGEDTSGLNTSLLSDTIENNRSQASSPETYFGAKRNKYLANGEPHTLGVQEYSVPEELELNKLYLHGVWDITEEAAASVTNASVFYKYKGKHVFIVAESDNGGRFEVWQDGELVSEQAGDSIENGSVYVGASSLYKLIRNSEPEEHVLELRVIEGNVSFFAFTFG